MAQHHKGKVSSLYDICTKFCMNNLSVLSTNTNGYLHLKPHLKLPRKVCEDFIRVRKQLGHDIDDEFMNLFADANRSNLEKVELKYSLVSYRAIHCVLQHKISQLDISGVRNGALSGSWLHLINTFGSNLTSLAVGDTPMFDKVASAIEKKSPTVVSDKIVILKCQKLKKISVNSIQFAATQFLNHLLFPLKLLILLDITNCNVRVDELECFEELSLLQALILTDVTIVEPESAFQKVGKLKNLRILDLSQTKLDPVLYENPSTHFCYLVRMLPKLVNLNVSGTNLAGNTEQDMGDIVGKLDGREIELLGMWNCGTACEWQCLPAKHVAGYASDEQLIRALELFCGRLPYHLEHVVVILNLLLDYVENNILETKHNWKLYEMIFKIIQDLCYINEDDHTGYVDLVSYSVNLILVLVKDKILPLLSTEDRRHLLRSLFHVLDYRNRVWNVWVEDDRYQLLVVFPLSCFDISLYDAYMKILMDALPRFQEIPQEPHTSVIQYILHNMGFLFGNLSYTWGMDELIKLPEHKHIIEKVLDFVKLRLQQNRSTNMAWAWKTLWDLVDTCHIHAKFVVQHEGLQLFSDVYKEWTQGEQDITIITNMLGSLAGISEVETLRPHIMEDAAILMACWTNLFLEQTKSQTAYLACYTLANMLLYDEQEWTLTTPTRQDIEEAVQMFLNQADYTVPYNFGYRTFQHVYCLLSSDSPVVQQWALWILQNSTYEFPDRYIPMLKTEGGIKILQNLVKPPNIAPQVSEQIKELMQQIASCAPPS